ncbi:MAG: ATP-binding cassette domain-containing protein [Gemmatimonadaceae bacterium]|nr:ATP-binding cassette domain-containing protein [Gemmatimonadaceae bacterium]
MSEDTNAVVLNVTLRQQQPIPLDVHFHCTSGTTLALIGPSGAGKSTILRTIAGLYRPSSAHIVCNGTTWLDTDRGVHRAAHERRTGLVFQSYALFPHLSALDNVKMALTHLPSTRRTDAADALLARVGLAKASARRPSSLSGGEQQRVALARALARDPEVLLLDEPFSAIDRRTRRLLHADLVALRAQLQAPIILVTHDVDEAMALASHVVVIDHGMMLQSGTVRDVLASPASETVRAILDVQA